MIVPHSLLLITDLLNNLANKQQTLDNNVWLIMLHALHSSHKHKIISQSLGYFRYIMEITLRELPKIIARAVDFWAHLKPNKFAILQFFLVM